MSKLRTILEDVKLLRNLLDKRKGGPGSGHFGHAGRPGQHGGSLPGGGTGASATQGDVWTSDLHKRLEGEVDSVIRAMDMADDPEAEDKLYDAVEGLRGQYTDLDGSQEDLDKVEAQLRRLDDAMLDFDGGISVAAHKKKDPSEKDPTFTEMMFGNGEKRKKRRQKRREETKDELWDAVFKALRDLISKRKGGPGSGHHGHAGRPGQRGGSLPGTGGVSVSARASSERMTVGITSAREGKTREAVEHEMYVFSNAMGHIDDVSDFKVSIGAGGWQESPGEFIHEPTWVTSYRGNGEALKLIKRTASKYEQDAVLLQKAGGTSPQSSIVFDDDLGDDARDTIQGALAEGGIGGWTWGKTDAGKTVLQTVNVPEWGGDNDTHIAVVDDLVSDLKAAGMSTSYNTEYVDVTVLEKGRDYD